MNDDLKECPMCGETKPLDEFHNNKSRKDGKCDECKTCHNKSARDYYHKNGGKEAWTNRYYNQGGREKQGSISMYKNKNCAQFLGIVVAERLIKHLFDNVTMMPYGHPGYDAICQRNKRINVKASTIRARQNKNSMVNYWAFNIEYNQDCDFFLCMAFDNVIELNPLIAWLIPGSELNHLSSTSISSTTVHKWDKWKMDMSNAQQCCDLMKEANNE